MTLKAKGVSRTKRHKLHKQKAWALIGRWNGRLDIPLSSMSYTKNAVYPQLSLFNHKDKRVVPVLIQELRPGSKAGRKNV